MIYLIVFVGLSIVFGCEASQVLPNTNDCLSLKKVHFNQSEHDIFSPYIHFTRYKTEVPDLSSFTLTFWIKLDKLHQNATVFTYVARQHGETLISVKYVSLFGWEFSILDKQVILRVPTRSMGVGSWHHVLVSWSGKAEALTFWFDKTHIDTVHLDIKEVTTSGTPTTPSWTPTTPSWTPTTPSWTPTTPSGTPTTPSGTPTTPSATPTTPSPTPTTTSPTPGKDKVISGGGIVRSGQGEINIRYWNGDIPNEEQPEDCRDCFDCEKCPDCIYCHEGLNGWITLLNFDSKRFAMGNGNRAKQRVSYMYSSCTSPATRGNIIDWQSTPLKGYGSVTTHLASDKCGQF